MSLIIDPYAQSTQNHSEDSGKITPHFLKTVPIPSPKAPNLKLKKVKFRDSKLHCNTCGRKRLMRLATMLLDSAGQQTPVYFDVCKLKQVLKDQSVQLPENYLGYCTICLTITPFKLKNRKLVADESPVYLDTVSEEVFKERVKTDEVKENG